jgi:hypothetical protein
VDRKANYGRVVAGLVTCFTGLEEDPYQWTLDGRGDTKRETDGDLIPILTKHEATLQIGSDGDGGVYYPEQGTRVMTLQEFASITPKCCEFHIIWTS